MANSPHLAALVFRSLKRILYAFAVAIGFGWSCLSVYASPTSSYELKPPLPVAQTSGSSFLIAQGSEQDGPMLRHPRNRFTRRQPAPEGQQSMEGSRERIPFRKRFMGDSMPLDLSSLNLTEEQKHKIQELRTRDSAKAREIRKALKDKRMQLRSSMFDPNVSDQEIRAKRKEMRKLLDQVEDVMLDDFLSIRSILTPEQRQRLPELKPGQRPGATRSPDLSPESGFEPALKRPRFNEGAERP